MTKSFGHKAGAFAGKAVGVTGAKIVAGAEAFGAGSMDFFTAFGEGCSAGYAAEQQALKKRRDERIAKALAAAQAAKLEMAKA